MRVCWGEVAVKEWPAVFIWTQVNKWSGQEVVVLPVANNSYTITNCEHSCMYIYIIPYHGATIYVYLFEEKKESVLSLYSRPNGWVWMQQSWSVNVNWLGITCRKTIQCPIQCVEPQNLQAAQIANKNLQVWSWRGSRHQSCQKYCRGWRYWGDRRLYRLEVRGPD